MIRQSQLSVLTIRLGASPYTVVGQIGTRAGTNTYGGIEPGLIEAIHGREDASHRIASVDELRVRIHINADNDALMTAWQAGSYNSHQFSVQTTGTGLGQSATEGWGGIWHSAGPYELRHWVREGNELTATLVPLGNFDDMTLPNQTYANTFQTSHGVPPEWVGKAMPKPMGLVRNMTAIPIADGTHKSFYIGVGGPTVSDPQYTTRFGAVYRNGRVVDESEYSIQTAGAGLPSTMKKLVFTNEQRDSNNFTPYRISYDTHGKSSVRQCLYGDLSIMHPFTPAGYTDPTGIWVGIDAGRDGAFKAARGTVEDVLRINQSHCPAPQAGMYPDGGIRPLPDAHKLNEDQGDLIEVRSLTINPKPKSISIEYRPSFDDPSKMEESLTSNISGGVLPPPNPIKLPQIFDAASAGKVLAYMAGRIGLGDELEADIMGKRLALLDRILVTSKRHGLTDSQWIVRRRQSIDGGQRVWCERYGDYLYVNPPIAYELPYPWDYFPHYAYTPPRKPTVPKIKAKTSTSVQIEFFTILETTSRQAFIRSHSNEVGGTVTFINANTNAIVKTQSIWFGAWMFGGLTQPSLTFNITGLPTGVPLNIHVSANNQHGLSGEVQTTINATAIGGGAAVTSITL